MPNPYRGKPDFQFWRKAVAAPQPTDVDPIVNPRLSIQKSDQIATAGSCFAQHIARTLSAGGYGYMVTEREPAFEFSEPENYGTFSARYGNIYTVRQLLQLFLRAYAVFDPVDEAWLRDDGRYIDPFRPNIQAGGFESVEQVVQDRDAHLDAVRTMFEECNVLIFTLGLTESWISTQDGAVFPLAPGVVAPDVDPASYRFHNFTVSEMEADLDRFLQLLKDVNPDVQVLLTVSPVPLIATFETKHALTATTYSKAALRVTAEQVVSRHSWVDYFPSYEMITGAHTRGAFFADDLREVRPEGVAYVMSAFSRHYMAGTAHKTKPRSKPVSRVSKAARAAQAASMNQLATLICDEESIEQNL